MESTLAQQAISLALKGKWEEAQQVNLQIISIIKNDIDALNRLARCYSELGNVEKAIATTNKVLKIDHADPIAIKCLQKWKSVTHNKNHFKETSTESFLEESGKTKIVPLLNPGESSVIANLNSGEEVKLSAHAHKVSVTDSEGKYVGRIPDDIAARIRNLIKNGVKYQVLVKSIDLRSVSVFVKEVENKTNITSFPTEKLDYVTFTPPELVHRDIPENTTEEVVE